MNLLFPELLILGVPLAIAIWKSSPWPSGRFLFRTLTALALLIALAGPFGGGKVNGRDLVIVVDRSRSMAGGSVATVEELTRLAADEMKPGDRLSLLTFAANTAIEQAPNSDPVFDGYSASLDTDGSNITSALEQALALIPENRPGSILLYSDGEFHGTNPDSVARRAAARGIHIDVRSASQNNGVDAAVESLELPSSVEVGEPFQFAAWVRSDREVEANYILYRDETILSRGTRQLRAGLNQLLFRDLGQVAGLSKYRLKIELDGDRVLANNIGLGVLRVEGNRPLLLINQTGTAGRLTAALQGAGMDVRTYAPENIPQLDPSWLENFRGIILENLPASSLGRMLPAIASQVENLGIGLLVTGGHASFGVGGYYRSALDPLLPVTMEVRVEHRKMGLALAFVLDRSGSMGASVAGGLTKMDLANAGTMEGIKLLSGIDEVTVIAVDTKPHVIVPLSQVDQPDSFADRVSGIRSTGGGIYTYTGLVAAAAELSKTTRMNRHIVVFADAADAEEPGKYVELLAELKDKFNTTVSVVALGDPGDSDAAFLQDVALRGGGEIYFSQDPAELPRLFAQDTLLAARSSFIDIPTPTAASPGLFTIANIAPGPWQTLPGYNLCYLRPGASQGVRTADEYSAPVIATMQAGLGRTAAFTGQVSGDYEVSAQNWPEVASMLVTLTRWISSQSASQKFFTSVHREGREAVVSVDIDRENSDGAVGILQARMVAPDGTSSIVDLIPVSADRFEARVPIGMEGVYRFAAATEDGEILAMDPLAVPYSPEFEPRMERDGGERVLGRIARLSDGLMNPPASEFLRGERTGKALKPLALWFALAGLLFFLSEITWRRLLEGSVRLPQFKRKAAAATSAAGTGTETGATINESRGAQSSTSTGSAIETATTKKRKARVPKSKTIQSKATPPPATEPKAEPKVNLDDALSGAKRKAQRRTKG